MSRSANHATLAIRKSKSVLKSSLLVTAGLSTTLFSSAAMAQVDEIVVTGTRAVIQDSINLKRQSTTIVDGLSADEIGELPALSIGEALESLTGASSHRENGGATEISIRGLGPFLSSTVFNGREATNGSGDRSVNFSQFPSELLSKVAIYKTQDASLIEGGVAGQIHLDTLRPLDYGKKRIQFDLKGNINPDQLKIDDSEAGDLGYRGTLSYVDQFDMSGGGSIGISLGGQISDISQPEQEIRSTSPQSSSNIACLVGSGFGQGITNDDIGEDDCEDNRVSPRVRPDGFDTDIGENGLANDAGQPFAFVGSQRGFRANDTEDKRTALFGAVQFQPNDRWDINFDVEYSERKQIEDRNDITFDNSRRNSSDGVTIGGVQTTTFDSLVVNETGEIQQIAYETDIALGGELFRRKEDYIGGGFDVDFDVTDRLSASADLSYSRTNRTELQTSVRVQTPRRINVLYDVTSGFPTYTLGTTDQGNPFDINDETAFDDNIRLRIDNDQDRQQEIYSGRLDFNYEMPNTRLITSVDVGARYSDMNYYDLTASAGSGGNDTGQHRLTLGLSDGDASIYECARDFPESSFLSSVYDGNIFTSVASDGSVVSAASGNTFGIFDNNCINEAILTGNGLSGSNLSNIDFPELRVGLSTTDVTEKTLAGYIKANYETSFDGLPIRGNIGVRVVDTDVSSIGYRGQQVIVPGATMGTFELEAVEDADGNAILEAVEGGSSYTEILPSFNMIVDINDDVLLRGAIFRGLSRLDPSDLNNRRSLNVSNDDDITNPADLITSATAFGNPNAGALTSWNFDAAVEWYPNEDSILAIGTYFKKFKGGFETIRTTEEFVVDGQTFELPINVQQVNEETSDLFGVELTLAHRFSYLPGALSGLGMKAGYNYAESDFEFEDQTYGDAGIRDEDGNFIQTAQGIVAPANIPGLSKHVISGQLYYQIGNFDIAGIYKYRSRYFQPFTGNGNVLRYVQGNEVFEARASYKINDNFKVKVEALNLFNEERVDTFRTVDNFGQSSVYGPRIFFGLQGKF